MAAAAAAAPSPLDPSPLDPSPLDTGLDAVLIPWPHAAPLSAQCVREFRAWQHKVPEVRIVLPDDSTVASASASASASKRERVHVHAVEQGGPPALVLFSTATATATPLQSMVYPLQPQSQPQPQPSQQHPSWLVTTAPFCHFTGADSQFAMFVKPGVEIEEKQHQLLNRIIVDMLHSGSAVGACEHERAFPEINKVLNYHIKPHATAAMREYVAWRQSPRGGGLKCGGDGDETCRVFDTRVVLFDMRHPDALKFQLQWAADAALSGEDTLSLFFVAQLLHPRVKVHVVPAQLIINSSTYCMRRLVREPAYLPPPSPSSNSESESVLVKYAIPRKLHMVWIGAAPVPEYCERHFRGWQALMPHWECKLWRNDDLASFSPEVQARVAAANHGAQKADILRAVIVEAEGGVYMDADEEPLRSLEPIVALNEPVVLCHELPLTWAYISNGMYGAAPHHPLVQYLADYLMHYATLNTKDIHMHTGPRALGRAVQHAPNSSGKPYCLLPSRALYYNSGTRDAFGFNHAAATWKQE